MGKALYAGTFDPITKGHMDVVERGAAMFEGFVVAVFDTPSKDLLFNTQERVAMCKTALRGMRNVEVMPYTGLTVEFARKIGASPLLRGLRSITDLDYEAAMVMMNRKLYPDIDTVFLYTSLEYQFVSSSLIKEVAKYGGDLHNLVPEHVAVALKKKYGIAG